MNGLLLAGVLLFGGLHLIPAALPGLRNRFVGRIGENPYKGVFSLSVLASLALIILGWRAAEADFIYSPPDWGYIVTLVLLYPALCLFVAARAPSNVKRFIRHPQLTGVLLWAVAHLLANGDSRSVILFGVFALWAPVEMLFLNRRDGVWVKPNPHPLFSDIKVAVIAAIAYAVLAYFHVYFTGVSLMIL